MLIKLDSSISEYIRINYKSINYTSPEIIAINSIAKAYYMGKHLLIADLEVIEFLIECKFIDDISKRVFEDLYSKYYYFDEYIKRVDYYIVATKCSNTLLRKNDIFYIPLEKLCDLRESMLIAENRSDAIFYKSFCNKMIDEIEEYNDYAFNLDEDDFGGSQVAKVVMNEALKGKFCLYIVDSDKDYKNHKGGTTLASARTIYNNNKNKYIIELYCLKVREKENLIPTSLYLLCDNIPQVKLISYLDKYLSKEDEEFLRYFDIKEGITVKKIKTEDSQWHELYDKYIKAMESVNILEFPLCDIPLKEDKDYILKGIGGEISEKFDCQILKGGLQLKLEEKRKIQGIPEIAIDSIADKVEKGKGIYRMLPEYLQDQWKEIFKIMYSWGCCSLENSITMNN